MKMKVKVLKEFLPLQAGPFILENPQQALYYCLNFCPRLQFGCAKNCKIRKHFKIPPHGEKYPTPKKPKRKRRIKNEE